jgi:hypothetical protein
VEALSGRVAELAEELVETRRTAAADHEYVITSFGAPGVAGPERSDLEETRRGVLEAQLLAPGRTPVGRRLEDRLVDTVAGRGRSTGPLVDLVVRTVALGHGVRRALTPDNLDRAAAESQVARRRSRRDRRRELREARRLLRDAAVPPLTPTEATAAAPSATRAKAQDVA